MARERRAACDRAAGDVPLPVELILIISVSGLLLRRLLRSIAGTAYLSSSCPAERQ